MGAQNKFTKNLTGFQSALISETRLHAVDPASTVLTQQTRSRRTGSETYTYTGGSKEAAEELKKKLEAMAGMGEVYGYSNDPADPNAAWTVVASLAVTGEWGAWA